MRAVLMESRFRVCASPERFQRFFKHTAYVVGHLFPEHVQRSCIIEHCVSTLLARQWTERNDANSLPAPVTWELSYGFRDPTGWLTDARLQRLSRDVLTDLDSPPEVSRDVESVPWMVTLTTDTDQDSRAGLEKRYPALHLAPLMPSF
ncbi:UNVERIFIED_CONTAM: hypothetical protein DES50_108183 [Williamsia faeni]